MPSTFSPNLRIELIGNGEQAGNWGSTTNTNLGTLIEDAISGYVAVSVTTANQAFTYADGADDQARNAMIELTTTTGAAFAVYAPPSPKLYVIYNASAHTATIYNSTVAGNTTAAGTGVAIPAGKTASVWTDGTDFSFQTTYVPPAALSPVLDQVYPVGSIYINATNATNPATLLGFGTWAAFGAGRVPVGFNAADPLFDAAEKTGGAKDAIVVAHTHTGTTGNQSADHTHSGTTSNAGSHTHGVDSGTSPYAAGIAGGYHFSQGTSNPDYFGLVRNAGEHNHSITTGGQSTSHNHAFTTGSTGATGTNANLQPYITVYMWKRTA
jgi:hypothetical protein